MEAPELLMSKKVCLITGATAGIGEVTARALARLGAKVVISSRNPDRCHATVERIAAENADLPGVPMAEYIVADLSEMAQVRRLAEEFSERFDRLDVLVNNAGAVFTSRQSTSEGLEMTFALNHLSYFLLTRLLENVLRETARNNGAARVVNVSSAAHRGAKIRFDDLQGEKYYNGWRAYGASKLANILFTFELDRRLRGSKITANALHPGFVATQFAHNNQGWLRLAMRMAHRFALSPDEGAATSIYLASSPLAHGASGLYYVSCRPTAADPVAYDQNVARRLWEVSEALTDISNEESARP
jgi:NAD(P)-dependent dehydrogenase (short-subunit alcohol dehydrogenase family)